MSEASKLLMDLQVSVCAHNKLHSYPSWHFQHTDMRASSFIDDLSLPIPTLRHKNCQLLLPQGTQSSRCSQCTQYRAALKMQRYRHQASDLSSRTAPQSKANYRYLSNPELSSRLQQVHHKYTLKSKQVDRLKKDCYCYSKEWNCC